MGFFFKFIFCIFYYILKLCVVREKLYIFLEFKVSVLFLDVDRCLKIFFSFSYEGMLIGFIMYGFYVGIFNYFN